MAHPHDNTTKWVDDSMLLDAACQYSPRQPSINREKNEDYNDNLLGRKSTS